MLLLQLNGLALRLQHLRPWCLAGAGLGIALSAYALAGSAEGPTLLLRLALVLALWSLLLFSFLTLFRQLPPPVLPLDSWWERSKTRAALFAWHLLALFVATSCLLLLSMSLKLLTGS